MSEIFFCNMYLYSPLWEITILLPFPFNENWTKVKLWEEKILKEKIYDKWKNHGLHQNEMFAQVNFFDENRHKIAYTMYLKVFDLHKLKMVPPMRAAAINYNKRPNFFIFFREFIFPYYEMLLDLFLFFFSNC